MHTVTESVSAEEAIRSPRSRSQLDVTGVRVRTQVDEHIEQLDIGIVDGVLNRTVGLARVDIEHSRRGDIVGFCRSSLGTSRIR